MARGGVSEHIEKRVVAEDRGYGTQCWIWTGPVNEQGYGRTSIPGVGPRVRIHRAMYEAHVGPIPEGLEIDHLCRVRQCCNPAHLEPVTSDENRRRALAVWGRAARTHCSKGHALTEENTGKHGCRACYNAYMRQWRIQKLGIPGYDLEFVCRKGHPRTPENTRITVDGSRRCRICQTEAERARRAKARAA